MDRPIRSAAWILAGLLALSAAAQESGTGGQEKPEQTPIPTEGFWPTRLMVDRMIDRVVEEMARHYDMDDDQREQARALFKEQIPQFMEQHRGEIQTLMNQFIEAQLAGEPPAVDHVAQWAQRAMPLLDKLTVKVGDVTDKMKEFMTDDQILKLDGELAAFYTGVKFASNKLGAWSEGGYDPETEWINDPRERRRKNQEEERRLAAEMQKARKEVLTGEGGETVPETVPVGASTEQARAAAAKAEAAAKARAKDEFDQYTEEFIRRYDFNEDQKSSALRFCEQRKKERDDYLARRRTEYERAKSELAAAKGEEEKKRAQAAFDKVNAPVERSFQKLKDSLEKLPTRAQRVKAAEKDGGDKAGGDKTGGEKPSGQKPVAEPKGDGESPAPKP